jgi:predicted transcriptional regulator
MNKTSKNKKYYVLSDNQSVQYVCNRNYFCLGLLDKQLEKEGYKTSVEKLDNKKYFYQKIITRDKLSDRENLNLISAYYPFLLKDQEAILAIE